MGVLGAAVASMVSQLVNFVLILVLFCRTRTWGRAFRLSFSLGAEGWRQFIVMLRPVLANEFLWSVG